jgi:regulator of replication initiation timing
MNIDQLRRQLRQTEKELLQTKAALDTADEDNKRLREENNSLKGRMHRAVTMLLPEGTTLSDNWDNFKEPGY